MEYLLLGRRKVCIEYNMGRFQSNGHYHDLVYFW